jgi:thiol:disulfide interchange protein
VPFGLTAYYDLDEAKAASKILKKPIIVDFTGWSCANCRKMENEVWSKPEILQRLKNDL